MSSPVKRSAQGIKPWRTWALLLLLVALIIATWLLYARKSSQTQKTRISVEMVEVPAGVDGQYLSGVVPVWGPRWVRGNRARPVVYESSRLT